MSLAKELKSFFATKTSEQLQAMINNNELNPLYAMHASTEIRARKNTKVYTCNICKDKGKIYDRKIDFIRKCNCQKVAA